MKDGLMTFVQCYIGWKVVENQVIHLQLHSDGDGDFRPTFDIDREYKKTEGRWKALDGQLPVPEVIFDAG